MRSEDEIREKIKAMRERGYQSYEFGDFIESEQCFAFIDGLKWVLQEDNQ